MKPLYLIFLLSIIHLATIAQIIDPSRPEKYIYPVKNVTLHLINHSTVKGSLTGVTDSTLIISTPLEIDSTRDQTINIHDIKSIKLKKDAFLGGLLAGAVLGGYAGYGIGHATEDDPNLKVGSGLKGAVIVGVPAAVFGSIFGSIATKRNFVVNGDKQNIDKMISILLKGNGTINLKNQ